MIGKIVAKTVCSGCKSTDDSVRLTCKGWLCAACEPLIPPPDTITFNGVEYVRLVLVPRGESPAPAIEPGPTHHNESDGRDDE
jgi:hypothetical protein